MEVYQLKQRQSLPLEAKILHTKKVIREWYNYWDGDIYISFSGGKDSTVLLNIVRELYPNIPAVFIDTGLEYPEIREFVKTIDNVVWLKPEMPFNKVIETYGYPVISKEQSQYIQQYKNAKSEKTKNTRLNGNKWGMGKISKKWLKFLESDIKVSEVCCNKLKKAPIHKYEIETNLHPMTGIMADESLHRRKDYLKYGCNSFDVKRPTSKPLAIWMEEDIWEYIKTFNVPYSKIYDMGYERTGCMFCMFGVHLEKGENRFQRMAKTHPKQHDYCINKLGCGKVLDFIGVDYNIKEEC